MHCPTTSADDGPSLRTATTHSAIASRNSNRHPHRPAIPHNYHLPTTHVLRPLAAQSNTFDSFKTSLGNTSTRFARSVASGKGNARLQLGIVLGFVFLFLVFKVFGGSGTPVKVPVAPAEDGFRF